MYVCKNCGQVYSEKVNFCGKCGSEAFDVQADAYANPAPSYNYAAPVGGSKVPSIIGMIFGITAIFFAFYQLIFTGVIASEFGDDAFVPFFVFSVFVLPFSIVGLIMSFKGGNTLRGMSITGKITSFISLGIWFLSLIVCLGNM